MKKKFPIVVRVSNPQLRQLRTILRLVLRRAFDKKFTQLSNEFISTHDDSSLPLQLRRNNEISLIKEMSKLKSAYEHSPLGCCVCGISSIKEDLKYNPFFARWYCEYHYSFNRDYYKRNPHPDLPSWEEMYP